MPTSTSGTAPPSAGDCDAIACTVCPAAPTSTASLGSTPRTSYLSFDWRRHDLDGPAPTCRWPTRTSSTTTPAPGRCTSTAAPTALARHRPRRDQPRRQHAVLLDERHRPCRPVLAAPATTPTSTAGTAADVHPDARRHRALGLARPRNVDGSCGSTPPTSTCPSAPTRTVPGARDGPGRGRRRSTTPAPGRSASTAPRSG